MGMTWKLRLKLHNLLLIFCLLKKIIISPTHPHHRINMPDV